MPVFRPLLALSVTSVLLAAEVPFGHADWVPSPTDPVGFAGQGQCWYPGATPPTQWSEGTADKDTGFKEGPAQGILWKVPVPSHSNAQPVVIGKRVVTIHSPHHVVCWNADTGAVLWQDALPLKQLPQLGKDRTSLEAAPGEKAQKTWERGYATYRLSIAATVGTKGFTAPAPDSLKGLLRHGAQVMEGWTSDCDSGLVEALEQTRSLFLATADGTTVDEKAGKDQAKKVLAFSLKAYGPGWNWHGYLSDVMAAPVSDGTIVGVQFGHGQHAAYELASGKRLWAFTDPAFKSPVSASHCPSPLLWKDLLLFPGNGAGENFNHTILAIDKKSGQVRWEASRGPGGCPPARGSTHGNHMSPCLVRLPDGTGGVRALVIANQGAVIDAETGAQVLQLPRAAQGNDNPKEIWGSGFVAAVGNRVVKSSGGDWGAPVANLWSLTLAPTGQVTVDAGVPTVLKGNSHGPFALSDQLLVLTGGHADPQTGKTLWERPAGYRYQFGTTILAGSVAIGLEPDGNLGGKQVPGKGGQSTEGLADNVNVFLVGRIRDMSDPAKPTELPQVNILGTRDMPKDIADQYFPEFGAKREFKVWALGGNDPPGRRPVVHGFASETAGATAHGSRLYVMSMCHLYCLGER